MYQTFAKKDNPTDQIFIIKLKKDGHCSFLGNDGLCGIQKKYGEIIYLILVILSQEKI